MVQRAAKVKIYTEQLQQQKLTLDDRGCMINHGAGGLRLKSRRTLRAGLIGGMCQSGILLLNNLEKKIIF